MRYYLLPLLCLLSFTSIHAETEIISAEQTLEAVKKRIVNINTAELVDILDKNPDVVLIDVRSPFELKYTGTINRGQKC